MGSEKTHPREIVQPVYAGRPVLVLIRLRGDTGELMTALGPLHDAQANATPTEGLVLHTLSRIPEGVLMADLWTSEERYHSFVSSSATRRGEARPSWPEPQVSIYDVHALIGSAEEMTELLTHRNPGSAMLATTEERNG